MKRITPLFVAFVLFGFLLSSCGMFKKTKIETIVPPLVVDSSKAEVVVPPPVYDYSLFPQGTILSGKMEDGSTLYLIRNDSISMAGVCFIDNNQAVVDRMSFFIDSTGVTTITMEGDTCWCKAVVAESILEIEIDAQTIRFSSFGTVVEKIDPIERFKNLVFNRMVAQKEIQYGSATGYYTSKPSDYISKDDYKTWLSEMLSTSRQHNGFLFTKNMEVLPLQLDIYQPANDNAIKRPIVLFIHGGAFFFGDKENKLQKIITDYVVKRGFVVASINYRLGTSITPGSIERTIYRDVQDARAALRFLVQNKTKYGIDEEQIYLAGSSAGGIISLTTAFMDADEVYSSTGGGLFKMRGNLGGLDDSGNDLKNSFKIAGVASMWGGITNLEMLNNHIPTLLFHGTADDVVPCNEGLPFKDFMGNFVHRVLSSFGKIYGSESVYNRLKSKNVPVRYIPFPGAGHDPYIESDESINKNMDVICDELGIFLYNNAAKHYFPQSLSGNGLVQKTDSAPVYQLNNLKNAAVEWHVDGGFITHQTHNTIRVIWYSSTSTGTITACLTNEEGMSGKKELKVSIR